MKNKLKLIVVFTMFILVFVSIGLLCACDSNNDLDKNPTDSHTHTFEAEYSYDEKEHWYEATCEHRGTEFKEKENHNFENGVCIKCHASCYSKNGLSYHAEYNAGEIIGYSVCQSGVTASYIEIPSSFQNLPVIKIAEEGFMDCEKLIGIKIPSSVTMIGSKAFAGCQNLKEIFVDEGNQNFSQENGILFNKDKTTLLSYPAGKTENTFAIPASVSKIGSFAFYGNYFIKEVTGGNCVTEIGSYAFTLCVSLLKINLSKTLSKIKEYAFSGCNNLISITIPCNVSVIENGAFIACLKLVEVCNNSNLPIEIKSKEHGGVAFNAFNVITKNNTESRLWKTDDNFIFYEGQNQVYLIGYCGSEKILKLPENFKNKNYSIYNYAFFYNQSVEKLIIDRGATSIGEYAFWQCKSLKNVIINEGVTWIDNYAFSYCSKLTNITFNGAITEWNALEKSTNWNSNTNNFTVQCTDGKLDKDGNEIKA